MSFEVSWYSITVEKDVDLEEGVYGIHNDTKLEKITPTKLHKFVSEVNKF